MERWNKIPLTSASGLLPEEAGPPLGFVMERRLRINLIDVKIFCCDKIAPD